MAFLLRRPVLSTVGFSAMLALYGNYATVSSSKSTSWVKPFRVIEIEGGGLAIVDNDKYWYRRLRWLWAKHCDDWRVEIEGNENARPLNYLRIHGLDVSDHGGVSKSRNIFMIKPLIGLVFPTPVFALPATLMSMPLMAALEKTALPLTARAFLVTSVLAASQIGFLMPHIVQVKSFDL